MLFVTDKPDRNMFCKIVKIVKLSVPIVKFTFNCRLMQPSERPYRSYDFLQNKEYL